jgi:predicted nucleic acid-binding protein
MVALLFHEVLTKCPGQETHSRHVVVTLVSALGTGRIVLPVSVLGKILIVFIKKHVPQRVRVRSAAHFSGKPQTSVAQGIVAKGGK